MGIDNYWYVLLFMLLPLLGIGLINYLRWQRRKRVEFAEYKFHYQLFGKIGFLVKIFPFLYILAFVFLLLSILGIVGEREEIEVSQKTNNIIFLLDVSNSMNAEDVYPNRLENAKNIVVNTLKEINGGRVGIVVFAGEAHSVMPLTTDISAAKTYVEALESSVIKMQGTDFLEAMKVAVRRFDAVPQGSRTIVMISDGEDNEDNESAMIKIAKDEGISVVSIGVGTDEGSPIPEYYLGQLMGYKQDLYGEIIISKLQKNALKNIATTTNGIYIEGNDVEQSVRKIINYLSKQSSKTFVKIKSQNATHYYQYFLIVALGLFFIIYIFKMHEF